MVMFTIVSFQSNTFCLVAVVVEVVVVVAFALYLKRERADLICDGVTVSPSGKSFTTGRGGLDCFDSRFFLFTTKKGNH